MEVQRHKKKKEKSRDTNNIVEDLEESVPEAPLMTDFQPPITQDTDFQESVEVGTEVNSNDATKAEDDMISRDIENDAMASECESPPVLELVESPICTAVEVGTSASEQREEIRIYPSLSALTRDTLLTETIDPCEEAMPTAPPVTTTKNTEYEMISETVFEESKGPEIISRTRPPPYTSSEIKSMYNSYLLESKEDKVKEFLTSVKSGYDGFELYELLNIFLRNCNQLTNCEKSLTLLKDQCDDYEKQVWLVTSESLSQNAVCMDKNNVVATHQFHVSNFDNQIFQQLEKTLKEIKELVKDSFSLFTYSVQLSRAQINHFFFKSFHHINLQSFEIQGYSTGYPTRDIQQCAHLLKTCISVLFIFVRKSISSQMFVNDVRHWLINSVSLLQRVATLADHSFILNHVIRCPPGTISKWAAPFIQIPAIPIPDSGLKYTNTFAHLNLDYALVVLATILNPVQKRDEFLKHYQLFLKTSGVGGTSDSSHQWVMVDSDGEDDPEDVSFFKESDLIALLQQVPFDKVFRRILFVYQIGDEDDRYDILLTSEQSVLKLIAFCSHLMDILGEGLVCYYTDRYRQLIKLIGRLMLHTAQYVTDHTENFLRGKYSLEAVQTISLEYDLFLLRTVSILVRGKNIGTLQFLAAVPFHLVSTNMLWEIYNVLTKWDAFVDASSQNENISIEFENEMMSMQESDEFYLLTTLSNMAIAREGKEGDFVRIVTLHLFQIGFLSPLTKDSCSKNARDLLSSLTSKYPTLISVLLHTIKPKMDILEKMSLFLLKELAFDSWKPEETDIQLLSHWLLNFPLTSVENQMTRFVIHSMNWDFNEDGELFLPYELHCKIALVIVEVQSRWEKTQNILTESVKQVTRTADGYLSWSWDIISRLHLHFYDRSIKCTVSLSEALKYLPAFDSHHELEPLRKSVENRSAIGCLVSLLITPLGHSVPLLCSNGFDLLEIVVQHSKYESVINALFFLVPLFTGTRDSLYKNEKFGAIMSTLLAADMTYMRMAKNLITADFPGRYTKLFGQMISAQLNQCERLKTTEKRLVRLWTETLTKISNWNKDNNILYLLDLLAKYSFSRSDCRFFFKEHFVSLYKEIPSSSQTGLAFLFSWAPATTTLLPSPSYPSMPYFSFYILNIELDFENGTGFWKSVCKALQNPKCTVDTAVKKACSSSKFCTTPNYLTIYRYAQLALDLPIEHELTLLIWQKFFLRFLHRVVIDTPHIGGVGERFFEGMINVVFWKKLKKRLHELVEYHREYLGNLEAKTSSSTTENLCENPQHELALRKLCLRLCIALTLWIEDSQIHKESLYPPALPPQFLPDKLVNLIDGDLGEWTDSVDYDAIFESEKASATSHIQLMQRSCWLQVHKIVRNLNSNLSKQGDLLKRLKTYDPPVKPPPVPIFSQILPSATSNMFINVQSMSEGINPHLKSLKEHAEWFSLQISQHTALNCFYCEILPDLYANVKTETLVNARCGGAKKWKCCSGPAHVVFKFSEAKLNEKVGHQIQQNRMEYHTLINTKGIQPPTESVCVAAVFIEDFITNLIVQYRQMPRINPDKEKLNMVGIELFHHLVELLSSESEFYPPTRQLFSSFLEVLGQEFISTDPFQSQRLITMCMDNPKLVESLAPHINFVKTPIALMLDIYKKVVNIPKKDSDLAFVILTKFDVFSWLQLMKPKLNERSQLISLVWKAVSNDEGTLETNNLMVHDTYRNHLKIVLLYDFQHYGEILHLLLLSSDKQSLPVIVWYDFFNSLSRDLIRFRPGMDACTRKREARRFATEADVIQHQELIETAQLLASHFTKERLLHGIYGLYPKYRSCVEPLSCFVQIISHTVVASSLRNSKGMLSQKIVEVIWPIIRDIYSPWIMPYDQKIIQKHCSQWIQQMNFENGSALQPWISIDSPLAMIYMNDFTDCVMFLTETLPGTSILFSYLWNFYVDNYAQVGVKDHVLNIVHQCFITIPWAMFWPTVCDLEVMNKVAEKYLPACHNFLGVVFAQVDWSNWIHNLILGNQQNHTLISKAHALVLNLTVRLANDNVARESPSWILVMEKCQSINWQYISSLSLDPILNWYVMSIDPRIVLDLESTHRMDKASLKVLKNASGYISSEDSELQSKSLKTNALDCCKKRYLFVRLYVRLLVTASSKHKNLVETHGKHFERAVCDMIDDIVGVMKKYKYEDCNSQLKELLSLMSNHYLGTVTRNAFIQWCETHKDAPLNFLYSVIQISLSTDIQPYVTVPLIETCIRHCFQHSEVTWETLINVSSSIHDQGKATNFFELASKDGHYLVLYCLLMKRYNHLAKGGMATVVFLTDSLKNIKPKESNESALPLIYNVMLKLSCELIVKPKDNVTIHTKKFLLLLVQHLSSIGDDKQSWGLLGALGLGKVSQLTTRGRLFARCLSLLIMVQLPTNAPIRTKPESEGHYLVLDSGTQSSNAKPHGELLSGVEKLDVLKLNRQYSDLNECIEYTLQFVKNPNNSLADAGAFIDNLNLYLFTEPFLVKRAETE